MQCEVTGLQPAMVRSHTEEASADKEPSILGGPSICLAAHMFGRGRLPNEMKVGGLGHAFAKRNGDWRFAKRALFSEAHTSFWFRRGAEPSCLEGNPMVT